MNLLKNYENLGNYGLITENTNGKLSFISGGKQFNKMKNKELLFPLNVKSKDYSEKIQLNYLSEFIQKIHFLYFNFQIYVPLAIKILKSNIFYEKYFIISKDFINYNELVEMINYCGGTVINSHYLSNLIFVEKENKKIEGKVVVSEEYIYDCYYMLYSFDENDDYYHFRNVIQLIE